MGRKRAYRRQRLLRDGRIRPVTIPAKKMTREQQALGRLLYPPNTNVAMPRTRSECRTVPRPCPFVRCKYNLYLDVDPRTGSLKLNYPDREPDEMEESCVLDMAARCGMTLEEVGIAMNMTRERVRQIESAAGDHLQRNPEAGKLREDVEDANGEKDRTLNRSAVPNRFKA
jgi:hypothetical protein